MGPERRTTVLAILGVTLALTLAPATLLAQQATGNEATSESENDELRLLVDDAIRITSRRYLTADVHTPWQILHGILALRQDFQIKVDGRKTSALEWLASGQSFAGKPIVEATAYGGQFHPYTQPYHFEGHPNQFLAIVTMSELPQGFEFKTANGSKVTIADMIQNAKAGVNDREEITWTLWSLARYIPVNSQWYSKEGEAWSMERLLRIQTDADPNDAACGGTHGLFAMSIARNAYIFSGRQLRGVWLEADQKIKRYIQTARATQNSDGTFSSGYFAGPGHSRDFTKRLATSGHILEFLMVAVTEEQLQQDWMRRGVRAVAQDLVDHRRSPADCGPLYHALHSLVLYQQRTGGSPRKVQEKIAQGQTADGANSIEQKPTSPPPPVEEADETTERVELDTSNETSTANKDDSLTIGEDATSEDEISADNSVDDVDEDTVEPQQDGDDEADEESEPVRELFDGPFQPTQADAEAADRSASEATQEDKSNGREDVTTGAQEATVTDVSFNEESFPTLNFQPPIRLRTRDMEENAIQTRPELQSSDPDAFQPPTED